MREFIAKYGSKIKGVLSGFDRLVLQGSLRAIAYPGGMQAYLQQAKVLLKDFGTHVQQVSGRLKEASLKRAHELGRRVKYLASSQVSKEEMALKIAQEDGVTEGLVCVLTCVEPCASFDIFRNPESKRLELVSRWRKCLHLYHYWLDPDVGFLYGRIQTWFPFRIQIGLNGREWLAKQMEAEGLRFVRQDNCFPWVADFDRAQALFDDQLRTHWPGFLDYFATQLDPIHDEIFARFRVHYYWSAWQSEWATDVVFRDHAFLRTLYPRWIHHGITTFESPDVMRFLGRKQRDPGQIPRRFEGEVVSNVKRRQEGVRIKHRVDANSIKLYDKAYTSAGSVLRVETTMNNPDDFKIYRPKQDQSDGPLAWRSLRRGVADLHRRGEVCQAANQRYLDALASVDDGATLEQLTRPLCQPVHWKGKRFRALDPLSDCDGALLRAISRGEFTLNGLRNRHLQELLFPETTSCSQEQKRRCAYTSRKIRLLRAHGILRKIPGEHRYHLTSAGRKIVTAVLAARQASVSRLGAMAA